MFVKRAALRVEIIRPADLGVAAGIAAPQPAFFKDRDVRDALVLCQVVGRGKTVAAATDDDDVVMLFRLGIPPRAGPAAVPGQGVFQ